jgi:dihydroorotase/N-acyl-D-amino-acid deacylase
MIGRLQRTWLAAVVLASLSAGCSPAPAPPASGAAGTAIEDTYDLVIAGGRIVDGTGAPWFEGDIAVRGDTIAAIGRFGTAKAAQRIDATGLVVAPGFIDLLGQSEFNVLVDGRAASKITQGVTTEITGEGTSIGPANDRMMKEREPSYQHFGVTHDWRSLAEYFARLEKTPPAINVGTFVGAGGLRDYVIGQEERPATSQELEAMKSLVAEAMEQGALGLSTSLQYVPDRFASTEEVIELAKVAARYGGIYISHQRSEGNKIFESLDEVFAIAEGANIPAEVWHLKTAYKSNWGTMPEVLRRIEAARARGLRVSANVYPYNRASNDLDSCLPLWVREGGLEKMLARIADPAQRERIKRDLDDPNAAYENQWYGSGGGAGVMVSSVLNPELRKYEGMNLVEIGRLMKKDARDALMDLVIADRGETGCIIAIMNEDDVRTAVRHPLISFGSDSGARAEDGKLSESKSHPRAWGTFTRVLAKYVREDRVISLEEAVRKMTSQAASRVGILDRGLLRPGLKADIVIFDADTVRDVATFEDPNHYSTGMRHVLVNGKAVVADGAITAARPGRPLRRPRSVAQASAK